MERTEAQHKQWQESQSQGLQAQSSCERNQEKTDNNQLSEMVSQASPQFEEKISLIKVFKKQFVCIFHCSILG